MVFKFSVSPTCVSPKMNVLSLAPEFDGKGETFAAYWQKGELWMLGTHLPLNRRAPALALAMDKMPRQLCRALSLDILKSDAKVDKIMETLH